MPALRIQCKMEPIKEKDMEAVINAENLKFSYKDDETGEETSILKGIDISVKRGEFLAVLGHNGSGKSTFAKHLNAINIPSEGKVTVCGMDTADNSLIYDIRSRVGMVFQNPDNQLVASIVEEDIAFAPENLGVPREEIIERIDYALKAVNMEEFRNHAPHMLSGGQKQRIAIAGVLAMKPEVIVLDEPTAMLDPKGRKEIMETIMHLNKSENMTVVLITHYMDEAAMADRIVVLDQGRVFANGSPREIFSKVLELRSIGLDVPQATYLAYELSREGFPLKNGILNDRECFNEILKCLEE